MLRDVSSVDTGRDILGKRSTLPFAFAPTGFTRMMNHEGERAVASVAQEVGIPYTLSTMGTTTIEDVALAAPGARKWFQLYLWRDRAPAKDLVQRAADAGYDTLMLTVDTPVGGARLRDVRNGLTIPPALSLRTFVDGAMHPNWWFNLLTTEPLTFASLESTERHRRRADQPRLRPRPDDGRRRVAARHLARQARGQGHPERRRRPPRGGRGRRRGAAVQPRRPPARPRARAAGARRTGGAGASGTAPRCSSTPAITHGADIVAAVALGARAALIGRAYLYGLMAGGRRGVEKAVEILAGEIVRTMQLIGVNSVDELRPSHVRLRSN